MRLLIGLAMIAVGAAIAILPHTSWASLWEHVLSLVGSPFGGLGGWFWALVDAQVPARWLPLEQRDDHLYVKCGLLGLGLLPVYVWARHTRGASTSRIGEKEKHKLRVRRQPWYRRLRLWWVHKLDQPFYWKVGRWVADLSQTHGLVVGGSGSGKSTLVVSLILQPNINWMMWLLRRMGIWVRRKVVIVSFDRSDPIEEATNQLEDAGVKIVRWRVRQTRGWKLIQGDREMIAEALPLGWPEGDNTGFFRQLATDALSAALQEQDEEAAARGLPEGATRDFEDMIVRMERIMTEDEEVPALARRTWVRRFKSLSRVMGDSLGDDFDLASLLAEDSPESEGMVLHLSCNSYTNPALVPLVGAMAITQIKMAAEKIPGVYVIFEEASFLKKRADLLDDLAKSLRARGWRIVYLNQDPQNVGDALQVNFGVAVFMGLGPLAVEQRKWCADIVKEFPGAFTAGELVLGATIDSLEGYVLLRGRCRDVSFAPFITAAAEHRAAKEKRRWTVVEQPAGVSSRDLVPSPSAGTGGFSSSGIRDGAAGRTGGTGETGWVLPQWTVAEVSEADRARLRRYGVEEVVSAAEQAGWSADTALPALNSGMRPSPPEYYVRQPLLLKEWPKLTGVFDANGDWLVPPQQVNGEENRAKVWVPKGTPGYGEVVENKGGYVLGYTIVVRARWGSPPPPEPGEDGVLQPFTVDHVCHTEDLTCPGGKACQHRRCMNGDHLRWVSPRVNYWRMKIHEMRRGMWLSGERVEWESTVCQAADEWVRTHPLPPTPIDAGQKRRGRQKAA